MATVIALDSGGRLGNKLIHFAAVYAWCTHRHHRLFNPAFYAYAPLFPNLDSDLFLKATHPLRLRLPMRRTRSRMAFSARLKIERLNMACVIVRGRDRIIPARCR